MKKLKLNGREQFNTLSREQQELVMDFFTNHCDNIKCKNMGCNNSPYEILNCPEFKRAYERYLIEKKEAIRNQQEAEAFFNKMFGDFF